MSVHKKIMQARLTLQSKQLKKSGQNKFSGYDYFELGDFLPTVQTIFSDIGLCGIVSFDKELATLTITDIDDNSNIVITSPMGGANLKGCHEVQNIGAVETYQRRYLWMVALEIVEHDAIDAVTGKDEVKPMQKPQFNLQQSKTLLGKCTTLELLKNTYTEQYKLCPDNLKAELEKYKDEIKSLIEGAQ